SADPDVGLTTISSPAGKATFDVHYTGSPPSNWTTYSIPFTAQAWGKSESDWKAILSNITRIQVELEMYANFDITGMDNFTIKSPDVDIALLDATTTDFRQFQLTYSISGADSAPFSFDFYQSANGFLDAGDILRSTVRSSNPDDYKPGKQTINVLFPAAVPV